MMYYKADISPY